MEKETIDIMMAVCEVYDLMADPTNQDLSKLKSLTDSFRNVIEAYGDEQRAKD